ncbi:MAG: sensor histidine kinase [Woeseiaceae bacterium]
MVRSRLFVGAQSPVEAAYRIVLFIGLFTLCLIAEAAFDSGGGRQAQAISCAGVIFGVIAISHQRWWPYIIALSLIMRFGFELAVTDGQLIPSLVNAILVVFIAAYIGILAISMQTRPRRELLTGELMRPATFALLTGSAAYGILSGFMLPDIAMTPLSIATSGMSFMVGATTMALIIICVGLPFGRPPNEQPINLLLVGIASILFQLGVSLGFNHYPTIPGIDIERFEYVLIWMAIPILIWISWQARGLVVALNLMVMLLVASFGWTAEMGHFNNVTSKLLLLEWQASVVGFTLTGIACMALSSALRYVQEKQQLQFDISNRLLAVNPYDDQDRGDTERTLIDVLADIGRFCGADECRLYKIDVLTRTMTPEFRWSAAPESEELQTVGFNAVRWFFNDVLDGRPVFYRYNEREHGQRPKLQTALSLPKDIELFCEPVGVDREVTGLAMLITYDRKGLALRDARPLLDSVGNFFASEQVRRGAQIQLTRFEKRLRELAASLTISDEKVRRHTSVDLHDGLIQQLAVARMKLGELRYRRVSAPDTVEKITAIIDETLATTRRIVQELSPSVLYELGLTPGIQSLCDKASESGTMTAALTEEGARCKISEPLMVSLYEVTRELIDNSLSHSNGKNIWVHVVWGDTTLKKITVSDDGVHKQWWQDEDKVSSDTGLGLLSNSERLRAFDYETIFERRPGGGTSAIVKPALAQEQSGILEA